MARRAQRNNTSGVVAPRTVYYPDPLAPRQSRRLTPAQQAAKRQRDYVAYLQWKERQIELAAREREVRRFVLVAGLVVGTGLLAAVGAAGWWLWRSITTATFNPDPRWAVLVLLVVAGGVKVGHRCVTTITHTH